MTDENVKALLWRRGNGMNEYVPNPICSELTYIAHNLKTIY
jgi:hypothetical protein